MTEQSYRWRVSVRLPGGVGIERYEGHVDVWGRDEQDAQERATQKLRATYGRRLILVDKVEPLPLGR